MTVVKKTAEHTIVKRRDGRFAVKNAKGLPVNGDEKVAILQAEGLMTKPEPKPEPVEEVAEEAAEVAVEEAPAEEAPAEEAPAEEVAEESSDEEKAD